MWHIADAKGKAFSVLFMIFFIIFGSFFLMNLFVAVIFDEFDSAQKRERRKIELMEEYNEQKAIDISEDNAVDDDKVDNKISEPGELEPEDDE